MKDDPQIQVLLVDHQGVILRKYGADLLPRVSIGSSLQEGHPRLADMLHEPAGRYDGREQAYSFHCIQVPGDRNVNRLLILQPAPDAWGMSEREELGLYRWLFNLPYEGAIFVDQTGVIRLVNEAFCNYLEFNREDLLGHRIDQFNIDPGLIQVIQKRRPDMLAFYPNPKLLATRQPVGGRGQTLGALGRYVALDMKCIQRNIVDADEYIDIISRLETRDIMLNVNQFLAELNSYMDEFNRLNCSSVGVDRIKGLSSAIAALRETILWIATSPSSVLITGESGTGKELFAQAIHFHGERSESRFVKVNCAAIPDTLLESELFGYVDGAFTGARKGGKMGKFELANHGTIFLDEIGDMPLTMQAKLLRVLQEKEIERIGDERTIPIDVRVISATNKDLKWMINQGSFRPDLYYRLNVVNLHIPALRERKEDIPILADHFLAELNRRLGLSIRGIDKDAMQLLIRHNWPGNVRELINVLETSMNFCRLSTLEPESLPLYLRDREKRTSQECSLKTALLDAEQERLRGALQVSRGNRQQAADILGVSRTTLYRLMKRHQFI